MRKSFDTNYYRGQAQKRLRLVYDYARSDLEAGNSVEVYHLCTGIAGVYLDSFFSTPERNVWRDIRAYGRYLYFYPEYPVGDDYVDFADPYKKIVLEVDSKLHKKQRDEMKNARLTAASYRVIRISQKYTAKDLEEIWNTIEGMKNAGRYEAARCLQAELVNNSEAVVKRLRHEFTPQKRLSKEDLYKRVALDDVVNSDEFKAYEKKYHTGRPKSLDEQIAAIPLYKERLSK